MEFERFEKIILSLKKHHEDISDANRIKIDLIDFCDPLHVIISELIKAIYGDEGYDWFSWFCYENDYGEKDWSLGNRPIHFQKTDGTWGEKYPADRYGAHGENGEPICDTIKSTWEYLETNYNKLKNGKITED
jgi:hypothetical protein